MVEGREMSWEEKKKYGMGERKLGGGKSGKECKGKEECKKEWKKDKGCKKDKKGKDCKKKKGKEED